MKEQFILFKDEIKLLVCVCLVLLIIVGCVQIWIAYCHASSKAQIAEIRSRSEQQQVAQAWPVYEKDCKHKWRVKQ